ncbi:MAG: hypothetical protein GKR89_22335 [Candidatus Latescibacteria bacterium]|nr:hypothetical protein [Candidatus Latescibacterota bacterium]
MVPMKGFVVALGCVALLFLATAAMGSDALIDPPPFPTPKSEAALSDEALAAFLTSAPLSQDTSYVMTSRLGQQAVVPVVSILRFFPSGEMLCLYVITQQDHDSLSHVNLSAARWNSDYIVWGKNGHWSVRNRLLLMRDIIVTRWTGKKWKSVSEAITGHRLRVYENLEILHLDNGPPWDRRALPDDDHVKRLLR